MQKISVIDVQLGSKHVSASFNPVCIEMRFWYAVIKLQVLSHFEKLRRCLPKGQSVNTVTTLIYLGILLEAYSEPCQTSNRAFCDNS